MSPYSNGGLAGSSTEVFNPRSSDSDIPLTNQSDIRYQQWDRQGKAIGYVPDPKTNFIFTPKPRVTNASFLPARDLEEAGAGTPLTRGREDSTDVVGWETAPATREYSPGPGMVISQPSGSSTAPLPRGAMQNPYSLNHQQSAFVAAQPQSMTSRHNDSSASQTHPHWSASSSPPPPSFQTYAPPTVAPRSPFDQAYAGYDDPYDSTRRHGHEQEPTDATFRTAFTSSPVHDDDLGTPMQLHQPTPGYSSNLR